MLCGNCKKNQATKTYEQIKQGKREVAYYCLECYHKLFIYAEETRDGEYSACPYCGTTATEVKRRKLVGCAHCYQTLQSVALEMVSSMQGGRAHKGKKPYETESERIMRRRGELREIQKKAQAEKDYDRARACETAISQLEEGLEEEYVWQKRRRLLKR